MSKYESPFQSQNPQQQVAKTKVEAKNKLDSVNNCPVCDRTMLMVHAAGVPVHYCTEHRVCLPQKD